MQNLYLDVQSDESRWFLLFCSLFVWNKVELNIYLKWAGDDVTRSKPKSKLQVRRLREADAGLYQCRAVNVVGQSESSVRVVVVPSKSQQIRHIRSTVVSYCLHWGCYRPIASVWRALSLSYKLLWRLEWNYVPQLWGQKVGFQKRHICQERQNIPILIYAGML